MNELQKRFRELSTALNFENSVELFAAQALYYDGIINALSLVIGSMRDKSKEEKLETACVCIWELLKEASRELASLDDIASTKVMLEITKGHTK